MAVLNKYHYGGKVPHDAVNIMRGTPYGNPFIIGKDGDRDIVIEKFRQYLWKRIKEEPDFRELIVALNGKDLCCCCHPKPCHGDVLERASKWLYNQSLTESPLGMLD